MDPAPPKRRPPRIFDRGLVRLRRQRSARGFNACDFLHRRAMADIVDRLETVTRNFERAVFIGAGDMTSMLTPDCGVETAFHMDIAEGRLPANRTRVAADEERLPLAPGSVDLIVSLLTLHTANDLVGALAQARAALKPDGLYLAAVFGEETLGALRKALYAAETDVTGGVSARIAPFATLQDFGQALARAGLALPVTDVEKVSVTYRDPLNLIHDLKGMGEAGALRNRSAPLRRDVFAKALEIFTDIGGEERFDIVYLTGWAPDENQPRPLRPGSATASLERAVKTRGR